MRVPPVIQSLREGTAFAHQRLDEAVDLEVRVRRADDRLDLVRAFYQFHAAAEAVLRRSLTGVDGYDPERASRLPVLRSDLAALGAAEPPVDLMPEGADRAEGLGWLYVVEGSALGGHVLSRQLYGQGIDLTGLGFLSFYGDDVGVRWRQVMAIIDREVSTQHADPGRVVSGARHAFDFAFSVLRSPVFPQNSLYD